MERIKGVSRPTARVSSWWGEKVSEIEEYHITDTGYEKISNTRSLLEQAEIDKITAACIVKLSEATFSDAYEAGKKMTLDDAVAYALGENRTEAPL